MAKTEYFSSSVIWPSTRNPFCVVSTNFLIHLALILTYTSPTASIKAENGVPVPGAEVLTDIFSKHLRNDGSLMKFIKGKISNNTLYDNHNLDIKVLDVNTVRKIIDIAKKKYEMNFRRSPNTKPYYSTLVRNKIQTAGYKSHKRPNPYEKLGNAFDVWEDIIYRLMAQTIYATQSRIEDTSKYRLMFVDHPSYKIALLYGACTQYINRMDSFYTQSKRFPKRTHYLWHLILYEKLLQNSVDLTNAVERIYQIQDVFTGLTKHVQKVQKGYLKSF